ncbi:MAG: hypothetical protein HBSAPP03_00880 [Phycisphaerae bacterium]|nr:MAG: hypothetical protein HBSAPP03_00880 [Phycisphaerae bacterium]
MDDFTVLCEDCGYDLAGLASEGACPECGRAVARSLPSARRGSAWQNRPEFFSWVTTMLHVLLRPTQTLRQVQVSSRGRHLLVVNLMLAGAAAVAPWWGVFAGDPGREARRLPGPDGLVLQAGIASMQIVSAATVLFLLTWIECRGIRFFAARRGWRLTHAGAWQVCAHASFGWLFCGGLATLFLAGMFSVLRLFGIAPTGTLDLSPILRARLDWSQIVGVGGPVLAYFAGLMIFEILIYKGVRACRFATTLRPG